MKKLALSACFLLLLLATLVSAQSGGNFTVTNYVLGGGGVSSGGGFTLPGTLGQHDAQAVAGGDFSVQGGFWQCRGETAVAPNDVTLTPTTGSDAELNWTASGDYAVWQGTAPYLLPHDGQPGTTQLGTTNSVPFPVSNIIGNPATNYYFIVMGQNDCDTLSSDLSNRTGAFDFGITPGN